MSIFCGINNNYGSLYLSFLHRFFSVLNPMGTVPVQVLKTQNDPKKRTARILYGFINVFIILIVFFYRTICFAFGIGIDALRIAGALSL
jgi:small neutral amino acid transporter SnatA (MarC family)